MVSDHTPALVPDAAVDASQPLGAAAGTANGAAAPSAGETGTARRSLRRTAARWLWRLAALIVAVIAALLVTIASVDLGNIVIGGKSLRTLAETRGSEFLGRPLKIGRISALLSPGEFLIENVEIAGATPGAIPFFTAKRLFFRVPWWTVLSRKELVVSVELSGWRMVTEYFPDQRPILPRLRPRGPSDGKPPGWRKYVERITVSSVYARDGEFVYSDHITPWSVICRNLTFELVRDKAHQAYVGSARFTGGTVQIQKFLPMSADFSTRFELNGSLVRLRHIDLITDGARTHLDGHLDFAKWPEQTYNIDSLVDFPRMREIFFANEAWDLDGEGRFKGVFHIYKGGRDLTGTFESHALSINTLHLTNLHGTLTWLRDRFTVTHADADFYRGRLRLSYGLEPLGHPLGATAKFHADVSGADLATFRRELNWRGLQPEGRVDGDINLQWPNGRFARGKVGDGHFTVTPPAGTSISGVALAPTLPAPTGPLPPSDTVFDKYPVLGRFPMGARIGFELNDAGWSFTPSWAASPTTYIAFSGTMAADGNADIPFHVTSQDWQQSDYLLAAILAAISGQPTAAIEVGGRGTFDGRITKSFRQPHIAGRFSGEDIRAWNVTWGRASGDLVIENRYLDITNGVIGNRPEVAITTNGRFSMGYPRSDGGEEMRATISITGWPLADIRHAFKQDDWPIDGTIAQSTLRLHGAYEQLHGDGDLRIDQGTAWKERFETASGTLIFDGRGVDINDVVMRKAGGTITGAADIRWDNGTYSFDVNGSRIPVQSLDNFQFPKTPLTGLLNFSASGSSSFDNPSYRFRGDIADLFMGDEGIGLVDGQFRVVNKVLAFDQFNITSSRLQVFGSGSIALNEAYDTALNFRFTNSSLDPYLKFFAPSMSPYARAIASGRVQIDGPLAQAHAEDLRVDVVIDEATLTLIDFFGDTPVNDYALTNQGPIRLLFEDNAFRIPAGGLVLAGDKTKLALSGVVDRRAQRVSLNANGQASLTVLQLLFPDLAATGEGEIQATYGGPFGQEKLSGQATIRGGRLRLSGLTQTLNEINGPIGFDEAGVDVTGLRARFGESDVTFGGRIVMDRMKFTEYDLRASGVNMLVLYPQGLRSRVDADLYFAGPIDAPVLGGRVIVTSATYRPPIDADTGLLSLTAGGAVGGGTLGSGGTSSESALPIRLNIDIVADRTTFIDNTEARLVGRANLAIVGTIARPVIQGRIDIEGGEVNFGANRLIVLPGAIDFVNNRPVFDLEAVTRPMFGGQTYDIDIRLRGTFDKLTPTLASDPFLPQLEIVSILFGGIPSGDRIGEMEARSRLLPQEAQTRALYQAGALLIASPLSARVGNVVKRTLPGLVDTVQLTPYLRDDAGQQLNPGVRLTLSRRITPRVVLTYSRALNTQYEIILLEYDQTDRLSWVLSRNEDRTFALDFRIRHVF